MSGLSDETKLQGVNGTRIFSEDEFRAIGIFSGRFPGNQALVKICRSWKVKYRYEFHASGWIVFTFKTEHDRDSVVSVGRFSVYRVQLHVLSISKTFDFDPREMCIVPVWVTLPNLPLELWSVKALSKISSKVGIPVSTDAITKSMARISYARVLVLVDASKDLVRSVRIQTPCGKVIEQRIVFECEPQYCSECRSITHSIDKCMTNDKARPIPKTIVKGTQQPTRSGGTP